VRRYADLELGFIARFPHARRYHNGPVVHGHLLISRIEVRLVAAGLAHRCADVIRHNHFRHLPKNSKVRTCAPIQALNSRLSAASAYV
jgi:hypothetical protein